MKQGEIWSVNLDPSQGAEIRKTRPAIIVSDDAVGRLPLKIIVPVTDWKNYYAQAPWMVRLAPDTKNKLSKASTADCFQVRSISETRFMKRIGVVDSLTLERIQDGLAAVLSLSR
ncbi:MAG: type II toxin-antitoxin system PemK/MazF family toxin [Flavobacteriales bacterium]|nr:type II toxin-antitoxin system PemK/MazF family toxin [Flavobacteriales bacterium]